MADAFDVGAARERIKSFFYDDDVTGLRREAVEALDALGLATEQVKELGLWAENFASVATSNIERAARAEASCVSLRQRCEELERAIVVMRGKF